MTFRPSVLPQRDDTFERAFQRGYNLVLGGQEQMRAQQEHEARMQEFADRAEQRVFDRQEAALDRERDMEVAGFRRAKAEGGTPIADALSGSAQMQEQRDQGVQGQRPGSVSPLAPPGATGERPPFGMAADPDAGGVQPQAPKLETNYNQPAIQPPHPQDFPDARVIGQGDQRYATSDLFNEQLAMGQASRAAEFGRDEADIAAEDISAEEAATIAAWRTDNPDRTEGLDDLGVLAQIALDQYTQRYQRAPPGEDRTANRQFEAAVTEETENRLQTMPGFDPDNMDPAAVDAVRSQVRAEVERELSSQAPGGDTAPTGFEGMTTEEILMQQSMPDPAAIETWYTQAKTGDVDGIVAEIQENYGSNIPVLREIHRAIASRVDAEWANWEDINDRPGVRWFSRNTFEKAATTKPNGPLEVADIIVGQVIRDAPQ